jgi:hypothetical protein
MTRRDLLPAEADFILRHMQEGMQAGESEKQLRDRRAWLSQRLQCSAQHVERVLAEFRTKLQETIGKYLSEEAVFLAQDILAGTSGRNRERLQKNLAKEFQVPLRIIRIATDEIHGTIQSTVQGYEDPAALLPGGEHFNYNTEVKETWRKAWQHFLVERLPAEGREHLRVLCLPGKQCLEIPLYLELGIQPRNIVGVEGGDRLARAEFEKNAVRFGIDARPALLQELLLAEKQPFDIVNFDFEGQMCNLYLEIFRKVPLSKTALLCVNVAARRERRDIQALLQEIITNGHAPLQSILSKDTWREQLPKLQKFYTPQENGEHRGGVPRDAFRELIVRSLGRARPELKLYQDAQRLFLSEKNSTDVASSHLVVALTSALRKAGMNNEIAIETAVTALELTRNAVQGAVLPEHLETYRYHSEPNHTPFLSHFLKVQNPAERYHSSHETIRFFIQCLEHLSEKLRRSERASPSFVMATDAEQLSLENIGERDRLYLVEGGMTIATMSLRSLLHDTQVFAPQAKLHA